ncbi:MAG: Hsp20/alpha crystallin family protein [Verrucomicrobiota bacterium]
MRLIHYQTPAMPDFSEFDALFNRMFPAFGRATPSQPAGADLYETPEGYAVRLELPGVNKEDIAVEVADDTLTIRVAQERKEKDDRQVSRFERSLSIPGGVDAARISARSENGLLTVELPKSEAQQPRKIEIA